MFSRPPGLAQSLASEIEEMIGSRGLAPGDRIANMEELRVQTGYGRATIGETVRLLAERGSVEVRPGRGGGLFVARVSPAVRLRQTLLTVPQGATTVADAIAVRDALEELIAVEAAAHRTDHDIWELESCLEAIRRAGGDLEQFLRANWALHERIAAIAPNQLARAMYVGTTRCIAELSVRADTETASTPGDYLAQRLVVHEELVAAIPQGDEDRVRVVVAAHRGDATTTDMANSRLRRLPAAPSTRDTTQPELYEGPPPAPAVSAAERIAALEQENRELRRANTILTSASAFFAAELDRGQREH